MRKEALKLALEALEVVTKELLAVRDEIAERGARPKTNAFHQRLWDSSFKAYTDHALPAATAIKEALMSVPDGAHPEQETQGYREAAQLAKWLFKTHYAQQEHYASGRVIWGLCDTTSGVISQIDNMVCKLVLPKEPEQEPVAWQVMVEDEAMKEFSIKDMAHDWCVQQKLSGSSYAYWIRPLYTSPPAQQEPVAVWELQEDGWDTICDGDWLQTLPVGTKLYTSPPQRKPLTPLEIENLRDEHLYSVQGVIQGHEAFTRAIEAAHGIKENT